MLPDSRDGEVRNTFALNSPKSHMSAADARRGGRTTHEFPSRAHEKSLSEPRPKLWVLLVYAAQRISTKTDNKRQKINQHRLRKVTNRRIHQFKPQ